MQDNKFAPEANELAEEALEQIAGGTEPLRVASVTDDCTASFEIVGDTCGGAIIGNTINLARGK